MEIKLKPSFQVIGLRVETNMENASKDCGSIWDPFMKRSEEIQNKLDAKTCLGVSIMKNETDFDYIAGYEVKEGTAVPHGMVHVEVPTGSYAVVKHKGTLDTLKKSYEAIMDEMKRENKPFAASQPCLEIYDDRFTHDEHSIMEIWMPIE